MHEIELTGCRPTRLMSYLKALGLLRLVAEQRDDQARGAWRNQLFVLHSVLGEQDLLEFFRVDYKPTPIVVPWSGNYFFGVRREGGPADQYRDTPTGSTVIEAFLRTKGDRLRLYRETIEKTLQIIQELGIRRSDIEKGDRTAKRTKARFIAALRSSLPDEVIPWIDCATVIDSGEPAFNTLLGSGGGNDAHTHFSDNLMQNLWDCLPEFDSQRKKRSAFSPEKALRSSLLGLEACTLRSNRTAALYDAAAVGGPNASQGMERDPLTNPWDFILAIEGTLCLAGAVVRRYDATRFVEQGARSSAPAFPFTTGVVTTGRDQVQTWGTTEREIWLPLWNRAMTLRELIALFSEGRSELGTRRASNGVEFARAIVGLGVDRGICEFTRYGILKGRVGGENYHTAVHLGGYKVTFRQEADCLEELDRSGWLERLRRECSAKNASARFPTALRRLDLAVLDYCRHGGKPRFSAILGALGRIEKELAMLKGRVTGKITLPPCPVLSSRWIQYCDDGTPEFRIAVALASITGKRDSAGKMVLVSLRSNLEPVMLVKHGLHEWVKEGKTAVWSLGGLCRNLLAVLARRLLDADRNSLDELPLDSLCFARLDDIAAFLAGATEDIRIERLLWGMILVDHRDQWPFLRSSLDPTRSGLRPPRAYALLKLLFMPERYALKRISDGKPVRPHPAIIPSLHSGDMRKAVELASQNLRAASFIPMPGSRPDGSRRPVEVVGPMEAIRLAAALLIPVKDTAELAEMVLRKTQKSAAEA